MLVVDDTFDRMCHPFFGASSYNITIFDGKSSGEPLSLLSLLGEDGFESASVGNGHRAIVLAHLLSVAPKVAVTYVESGLSSSETIYRILVAAADVDLINFSGGIYSPGYEDKEAFRSLLLQFPHAFIVRSVTFRAIKPSYSLQSAEMIE
mgnify:CR=1 FL=1